MSLSSSLLDPSGEMYASFSQKNLVRLAALSESQRTLSLFTPNIRDAVYRAWASASERHGDGVASPLHNRGHPPSLSRIQSTLNMQHGDLATATRSVGSMSSAASHTSETASHATRPSLVSNSYTSTSYTLSSGRSRPHGNKKRKHRVVNLRRNRDEATDGAASETMSQGESYDDSASKSESLSASGEGMSSSGGLEVNSTVPTSSSIHRDGQRGYEGEVHTPNTSPQKKLESRRRSSARDVDKLETVISRAESSGSKRDPRPVTPRNPHSHLAPAFEEHDADPTPRQSMYLPADPTLPQPSNPRQRPRRQQTMPSTTHTTSSSSKHPAMPPSLPRSSSELSISDLLPSYPFSSGDGSGQGGSSGGILEQAWMTKMATEIARRVAEERERQAQFGSQLTPSSTIRQRPRQEKGVEVVDSEGDGDAPPAYAG